MKLLKHLIGICLLCSIVSITFAAEIKLVPATGEIGNGCSIPVEIRIDTDGKTISATDLMMESSLEFVDFVPTKVFPYFLPPTIVSNAVHIIGFAVDPAQRVSGRSLIGTAYFKKRSILDRDGAIRLYFTNVGDTIDSNLSLPGGIDILDKVNSAYYTFVDTGACIHPVSPVEGGIKGISLNDALAKVSDSASLSKVRYAVAGGIILVIAGVFYFAKARKGKKRG